MPSIPQNTGTTRSSNKDASNKRLIGISFPFRKENGEFPAMVRDAECVQNDIFTLFKTPLRSRVMRPDVGHLADAEIFNSQGALLNARIQRMVRQTMNNNETRAITQNLELTDGDKSVNVVVNYETQGIQDSVELPAFQKI